MHLIFSKDWNKWLHSIFFLMFLVHSCYSSNRCKILKSFTDHKGNSSIISNTTHETLIQCREKCFQDKTKKCQSFSYNLLSTECLYFNTSHRYIKSFLIAAKNWIYMLNPYHLCSILEKKPCVFGQCYWELGSQVKCLCDEGFSGLDCSVPPSGCQEFQTGSTSGIKHIDPDGQGGFDVWCDIDTPGGPYTVFQRRHDLSEDFYRTWEEYKNGFGDLSREFWLGNEKIHRLTKAQSIMMRVDLAIGTDRRYTVYNEFKIASEAEKYRLHVAGYNGTAGPGLAYYKMSAGISNGCMFSTKDEDNDNYGGNCATLSLGGWWFNACYSTCLNCKVIEWYDFNAGTPKTFSEMKMFHRN